MCWRQFGAAADAQCTNKGFHVSDFPANDTNDLEIKKRARHRLVGATVLALLAVIVLPLTVKDSEAPHTVPDMQVSIPERGEFELPPVVPENDPESARIDIEPDTATGVPGFPVEMSPPLPEPDSKPVASLPPERPAPTPPAAQPSRESRQAPPAAAATEAARALALLNNTASVKETNQGGKTAGAQGKVFVQIGSYSKAANAAKQAEELKKQGYAAYAEKAGKVTRVRIGPLSPSEGEQIVARLKSQGRNAVLSSR